MFSLDKECVRAVLQVPLDVSEGEVGGWGRDPKKCTGRDWVGGGVEYHLMSPTPRR